MPDKPPEKLYLTLRDGLWVRTAFGGANVAEYVLASQVAPPAEREIDSMTDLISRRDAQRVISRIYGCSDHDQPEQCADCDLRHKVVKAIAALPSVSPPSDAPAKDIETVVQQLERNPQVCVCKPFCVHWEAWARKVIAANCTSGRGVEYVLASQVAPPSDAPSADDRELAQAIVDQWVDDDRLDDDWLVDRIAAALAAQDAAVWDLAASMCEQIEPPSYAIDIMEAGFNDGVTCCAGELRRRGVVARTADIKEKQDANN